MRNANNQLIFDYARAGSGESAMRNSRIEFGGELVMDGFGDSLESVNHRRVSQRYQSRSFSAVEGAECRFWLTRKANL